VSLEKSSLEHPASEPGFFLSGIGSPMAENTFYFENMIALTAQGRLSIEDQLAGLGMISMATQEDEVVDRDAFFQYALEHFADWLKVILCLSREQQEMLLAYYLLAKTQKNSGEVPHLAGAAGGQIRPESSCVSDPAISQCAPDATPSVLCSGSAGWSRASTNTRSLASGTAPPPHCLPFSGAIRDR
jgi:hypothetical protein